MNPIDKPDWLDLRKWLAGSFAQFQAEQPDRVTTTRAEMAADYAMARVEALIESRLKRVELEGRIAELKFIAYNCEPGHEKDYAKARLEELESQLGEK